MQNVNSSFVSHLGQMYLVYSVVHDVLQFDKWTIFMHGQYLCKPLCRDCDSLHTSRHRGSTSRHIGARSPPPAPFLPSPSWRSFPCVSAWSPVRRPGFRRDAKDRGSVRGNRANSIPLLTRQDCGSKRRVGNTLDCVDEVGPLSTNCSNMNEPVFAPDTRSF